MARLTVEDCLKQIDNRFELVLLASKRARQLLTTGANPLVPAAGDKATVIALREIASGAIKPEQEPTQLKPQASATQNDSEEISQEIIEETQQTVEPETTITTLGNEDGNIVE